MGEVLTKAERVRRREHLRGGGGACAEAASLSPTLHSVMHPETAEVYWGAWTLCDPYGVEDLSEEYQCIGRNYFARSPGSDVWVSFHDLPKVVCDRLWQRIHAGDREYDLSWLL